MSVEGSRPARPGARCAMARTRSVVALTRADVGAPRSPKWGRGFFELPFWRAGCRLQCVLARWLFAGVRCSPSGRVRGIKRWTPLGPLGRRECRRFSTKSSEEVSNKAVLLFGVEASIGSGSCEDEQWRFSAPEFFGGGGGRLPLSTFCEPHFLDHRDAPAWPRCVAEALAVLCGSRMGSAWRKVARPNPLGGTAAALGLSPTVARFGSIAATVVRPFGGDGSLGRGGSGGAGPALDLALAINLFPLAATARRPCKTRHNTQPPVCLKALRAPMEI